MQPVAWRCPDLGLSPKIDVCRIMLLLCATLSYLQCGRSDGNPTAHLANNLKACIRATFFDSRRSSGAGRCPVTSKHWLHEMATVVPGPWVPTNNMKTNKNTQLTKGSPAPIKKAWWPMGVNGSTNIPSPNCGVTRVRMSGSFGPLHNSPHKTKTQTNKNVSSLRKPHQAAYLSLRKPHQAGIWKAQNVSVSAHRTSLKYMQKSKTELN